ncbi:hypothetical protein [Streptomyces gibsoniae]|uniref:Uncharacterized protein n=1 Tax=Streptomyces gibsoniae TaxID=3075529 RepID=A0ABU2U8W1_9ACTN|nr:hypothetical protein [Streptomyces sp. DSM 41699]MDT0469667.1 hypothetical protein [Streptomyces sp. DSM 41699]
MNEPSRIPAQGPQDAAQGSPLAAVGDLKGAARQGVVSALRSKRFPARDARHSAADPTPDQPGIRIYAPPVYRSHDDGARWSKRTGDTPTAAYACPCGQTGTAIGPRAVAALVAECEAHTSGCTGTPTPLLEGRTAA